MRKIRALSTLALLFAHATVPPPVSAQAVAQTDPKVAASAAAFEKWMGETVVPPNTPMTFTVGEHDMETAATRSGWTFTITASGQIGARAPGDLLALIDRHRIKNATVYLSSDGGDLLAGLELGRLIRSRGFSTTIGSVSTGTAINFVRRTRCLSACAYIFLGGLDRTIASVHQPDYQVSILRPKPFLETEPDQPQAALGFHQFRLNARIATSPEILPELNDLGASAAQELSARLANYLTEMGVRVTVLDFAERAHSQPGSGAEPMYFPSRSELVAAGVLNSGGFGEPRLLPDADGMALVAPFTGQVGDTQQLSLFCVMGVDGSKSYRLMSTAVAGDLAEFVKRGDPRPPVSVGRLLRTENPAMRDMTTSKTRWMLAVVVDDDVLTHRRSGTADSTDAFLERLQRYNQAAYDNYLLYLTAAHLEKLKRAKIVTIALLAAGQGFEHDIAMNTTLAAEIDVLGQHCFPLGARPVSRKRKLAVPVGY